MAKRRAITTIVRDLDQTTDAIHDCQLKALQLGSRVMNLQDRLPRLREELRGAIAGICNSRLGGFGWVTAKTEKEAEDYLDDTQ